MAQRYETIAAHTRRHASVLVVFVVFCVHMHSFAGLIRRTPPPTFSDTAITHRHSDTTIFQLRAHWCGYPGLLDRKNRSDMCLGYESNPRLPACKASTQPTRPGSPLTDTEDSPISVFKTVMDGCTAPCTTAMDDFRRSSGRTLLQECEHNNNNKFKAVYRLSKNTTLGN